MDKKLTTRLDKIFQVTKMKGKSSWNLISRLGMPISNAEISCFGAGMSKLLTTDIQPISTICFRAFDGPLPPEYQKLQSS